MTIYLGSYKNLFWVGVEAERVLEAVQGLSLHNTSQSSMQQQPFQCIHPNFKASIATQLSLPPYLGATCHLCPITMLLAFHAIFCVFFIATLIACSYPELAPAFSLPRALSSGWSPHNFKLPLSYFYSVSSKI